MERVTGAKSVSELQGHRVLYQTQGSGRLQEGNVTELAGESSQFVNLGNGVWERVDRVTVVVDLGTPEVLPGRGNEGTGVGLRQDGPTLEEFVAKGYKAENYPPAGYAPRTSAPPALAVVAQGEAQ